MTRIRPVATAALLTLALGVAGCGAGNAQEPAELAPVTSETPTPKPSPSKSAEPSKTPTPSPPVVPKGVTVARGTGYTFWVPVGWKDVSPMLKSMSATIELGYAGPPVHGYSNNMNVVRTNLEKRMTPDQAEKQFARELGSTGVEEVETQPRTTIAGVLALHQTGVGRYHEYPLTFDQYATFIDDHWVAITFINTTGTTAADRKAAIAFILKSWRWFSSGNTA